MSHFGMPVAVGPSSLNYETVAADQTAQVLGATGAKGDYVSHVVITPASTDAGAVTLIDDATSITLFAGGTGSVGDLRPFSVPLDMVSASGAWKVTTGGDVSCVVVGMFSN